MSEATSLNRIELTLQILIIVHSRSYVAQRKVVNL